MMPLMGCLSVGLFHGLQQLNSTPELAAHPGGVIFDAQFGALAPSLTSLFGFDNRCIARNHLVVGLGVCEIVFPVNDIW